MALIKRMAIIFICVLIFANIVSLTAEGTDASEFFGGNGTAENPYLISTVEHLNNVRYHLDSYFKQISDIDLASVTNWQPIGSADSTHGVTGTQHPEGTNSPFIGCYDGNNYKIFNAVITDHKVSFENDSYGLFASLGNCTVKNVHLDGINYSVNKATTDYVNLWNEYKTTYAVYVGGIAGKSSGDSIITNCSCSGIITVTDCSNAFIGGLLGYGKVTKCENSASIYVNANSSSRYETDSTVYCGGIVGQTPSVNGVVSECINSGNISATAGNFLYVGGISGEYGRIENCVNFGDVDGRVIKNSGYSSFAGNCNAGGIVGATSSDYTKCCVNYGNVSASTNTYAWSAASYAGGIVGYCGYYGTGKVFNCVNIASRISSLKRDNKDQIIYANASRIAGMSISISDCYSSVLTIVNESTRTGSSTDENGEDVNPPTLLTQTPYKDFDFSNIWCFDDKCGGAVLSAFCSEHEIESPCNIYIWLDDKEQTFSTDKCIDYYIINNTSTTYSPLLAAMMMGLADGSYDPQRLVKGLKTHGFENNYISPLYDLEGIEEFTELAAFTISHKDMVNGEKLVIITVRGSQTVGDWLGNFMAFDVKNLLSNGYHPDFSLSADYIIKHIKTELGGIDKSNTKFLITGHSRGAAVSNLLSKKLMDEGVPQKNLYSYNFACPDVGVDSNFNSNNQYGNIFNIGCYNDIVPFVPGKAGLSLASLTHGSEWGKYGITKWFAIDWDSTNYFKIAGFKWPPVEVPYHMQPNYLRYMLQMNDFSQMRYTHEIPKHKIKSLFVQCPVDVILHDSYGHDIITVENNNIEYHNSEAQVLAVIVEENKKLFYIFDDEVYTLSMNATDAGTMNITAADIDSMSGTESTKTFENISLVAGKRFEGVFANADEASSLKVYTIDNAGNWKTEVQENGEEKTIDEQPHTHTYTATVTTKPTCIAKGETTFTCSICGDTYTEPIPATGEHDDADNNGYCDSCEEMMQGGKHCKYCGKIHDGLFGWLVKFFHSILAIFKR